MTEPNAPHGRYRPDLIPRCTLEAFIRCIFQPVEHFEGVGTDIDVRFRMGWPS